MQDRLMVVVVGAGAAGSAAAVAVRGAAPTADVVVVGAEEWGPYNRTTVNKGLLSGAVDDVGIALPGIDRIGIDWRTGTGARSLDARARIVELGDGSPLERGRVAASSLLADLGLTATADTVDAPAPSAPTPTVLSYSTYVHGTKLTVLGWPAAAVTERAILGRVGDPRFALALLDATERVVGAVGVGGARAVNRVRPLIARRALSDELDPHPDAHLSEAAPRSGVRVRSA